VLEFAVCCKIVVASKTVSSEATSTCSNKAARQDMTSWLLNAFPKYQHSTAF